MKYKELFTPIKIGSCKIKNRFAMAPMGPLGLADADGGWNQRGIDYYTERAKGGTGLIITGVSFAENKVETHGTPNTPCATLNSIHFIRTSREMTERIHAYGAKVFFQMSGGFGRVIAPELMERPVAPSPIPYRWNNKTCRELQKEEIRYIVEQCGKGAFNAKRAGFDGIQVHAVHEGYLIDQFAITLFNKRTDEYGGSLENRLRFAKEILEEIKKTCGEDFPVTLRFSPKSFIKDLRDGALPEEEFKEKGRDIEEGIEAAKLLVKYGYDALDVDVGSYDSWWWNHPPMYQKKGLYRPYAKLMKKIVDAPIICAGRMDDPDMALEAIEDGTTDMISMGRPLLADPDYVNKLRAGKVKDIRPCISCQEGCMGRLHTYFMINCAVNPQACRERYAAYTPILAPKKVLIVGGGVAGCEAARVLAIRGHKPELFEKESRLGGNLLPGGSPEFKKDDIALADWYANTLAQMDVPIHLNTELTKDDVLKCDADAVVIATGSTPKRFSLGDNTKVFIAADVLMEKVDVGDKTVVIGGGLVGCETALWLAQKGKKVTIVEALDKLLAQNGPLCHANREMLEKLIPYNNIEVIVSAKASDYVDGVLTIEALEGKNVIKCDSVILSVGYEENADLYRDLEFEVPEIYLLGDANKVSNIMYGIWDAFEVANHI